MQFTTSKISSVALKQNCNHVQVLTKSVITVIRTEMTDCVFLVLMEQSKQRHQ